MSKKLLCLVVILTSLVLLVCGFNGATEENESRVAQIVPTIKSIEISVEKSTSDISSSTPIIIQENLRQNVNQFIRGMVTDVHSGNGIEVTVDGVPIEIVYHGVLIPQNDEKNFLRAKELNKFLVLGKEIDLDVVHKGDTSEGNEKSAFVFYGGEMINLRMLRSGFAILGDFQGESSRLIEFQNAQSQAEDMKLGIWEIDIKNSCGTLPCR
tara:strand:+ start:232 stop:864 length:633 start_codon:yes stop_codon:yes gene_type:complete